MIGLLRHELRNMRNPEFFHANRLLGEGNICSYWSYLLERANEGRLPFQDTLGTSRYFAHKVWHKLSEHERITFQRSFGAFWACWRHPIPNEVIRELNQYAHEGRLHIHRPAAPLRQRGKSYVLESRQKQVSTDMLVDGTGGSDDMTKVSSPLVRNLLKRGLAKPHPCGGLRVDNLTYALIGDSKQSGIYCLGPLAKGELFSTNAFWFNAQCAAKLAHLFAIEMSVDRREVTTFS